MVPVILKLSEVGVTVQSLTYKAADAEAGRSPRTRNNLLIFTSLFMTASKLSWLNFFVTLIVLSGLLTKSGNYLRLFRVIPNMNDHLALPLDAACSYLMPHYENKHLHHLKHSNRKYRGPYRTSLSYLWAETEFKYRKVADKAGASVRINWTIFW